MSWESIQKFFRENPRAWLVGAAAALTLVVSVWGIWGGFSLQFGNIFAEGEQYCTPSNHSQPAVARLTIKIFFVEGYDTEPNPIPLDSVIRFDATGKSAAGQCLTDGSGNVVWSITPSDGGVIIPRGGSPFTPTLRAIKSGTYQIRATLDGINSNALTITVVGGTPSPSTLRLVSCTGGVARLSWTIGANANTNLLRRINAAGGSFETLVDEPGRTSYTNTVPAGTSYRYSVKSGATVISNEVTCSNGGVTPTPTTTTTATPTPVYPPLTCAPLNQTVALAQVATVTATGGSGIYQWDLPGSGVQQGGTATSVSVSYSVSGQKVVRVSSGGQIATCVVVVTGIGGDTQSSLTVIKLGLNAITGMGGGSSAISINPNEIAQFTVSITNNGTTAANSLKVLDTLPNGMSYRNGSTTINGQVESANTITTSGLALDSLEPGANVNIQWSATADATGQLAAGPQQSRPRVLVTAANIPDATADMSVTIYGSGFAGGGGNGNTSGGGNGNVDGSGNAGGVATGPGEAVTIALVIAAALTLLYSGYTRSSAYRVHEADTISRDQGPMDFRS